MEHHAYCIVRVLYILGSVYPGTVNYWTGRPGEVVLVCECECVRVVVRRARCRAKELEETRPLVRAMTK